MRLIHPPIPKNLYKNIIDIVHAFNLNNYLVATYNTNIIVNYLFEILCQRSF